MDFNHVTIQNSNISEIRDLHKKILIDKQDLNYHKVALIKGNNDILNYISNYTF